MLLDSHQHFWQYQASEYPWMSDAMAVLRRDYLPADLAPLLRSIGFDGSVVVQARQSMAETDWLLQLAETNSLIKAVVGWVDLRAPDLPRQLERIAAHPKLAGVRHVVQDEPDDEFVLRPEFRRGIARLKEFDLTYDLLVFPRQLPAAIRLVAEFPDQPFVLDHIAKPAIRDGQTSPWNEEIRELARFSNVCCKLSGMVTEAKWQQWHVQDFHPYLEVILESFSPERLMIGSDWPVCTLSGDYASTMSMVVDYIQQLTPPERAAILGENCARFYGVS